MRNVIFILILCVFLTGCNNVVQADKENFNKEVGFIGESWIRTTEYDTETISFDEDGTFHYSCACGNPINNSDICDQYTYNVETKEIKLVCYEKVKNTTTLIKVIRFDNNILELDFDGEIRKFTKE